MLRNDVGLALGNRSQDQPVNTAATERGNQGLRPLQAVELIAERHANPEWQFVVHPSVPIAAF